MSPRPAPAPADSTPAVRRPRRTARGLSAYLLRGLVALVAAATVLSGCAGLSMDSPVEAGLPVGADQGENVRIQPPDPAPGASPVDIVRGFIRGGAASEGAYDAARAYLARSPRPDWRPDIGVRIYRIESGLTVKATSASTVRVTVPVQATIDRAGRYAEAAPGTVATADFTLEQSSGEWRIAQVPADFGLWLGSFDAEALFRPYRITYVSTFGRRLVPDVRWFSPGTGLATRLARAQLDAVPEHLAGSASTAVPGGARLAVDAVPVEDGVATVDLDPTTLGSDTVSRQNLWAQFYSTLVQVPGVSRVLLRQEGADLALPGVAGSVGSLGDIGFPIPSPRDQVSALLRSGTTLRPIDPQQLGDVEGDPPADERDDLPVVGTGWVDLALAADGSEVAGVSGSRDQLTRWRGVDQLFVPQIGVDLTRPTYDHDGILWVGGADRSGQGALWVIDPAADPDTGNGGAPVKLSVSWLQERRVVAVRVSADGTLAAVISIDRTDGDTEVDVAGIQRGPDAVPVELSAPLRVAPRLVTARDLVWTSDTSLAVLGQLSVSSDMTPWLVQVGGPSEPLTAVADATTITTVSGERGLVLGTSGNDVQIRAGASWLSVAQGEDLLAPAT